MSSNDYTPVTSGALKLKGLPSKLSKKKRPKPALPSSGTAEEEVEDRDKVVSEEHKDTKEEDQVGSDKDTNNEEQQSSIPKVRKTEAEIRHEQRRRRKVISSPFAIFPFFPPKLQTLFLPS